MQPDLSVFCLAGCIVNIPSSLSTSRMLQGRQLIFERCWLWPEAATVERERMRQRFSASRDDCASSSFSLLGPALVLELCSETKCGPSKRMNVSTWPLYALDEVLGIELARTNVGRWRPQQQS